MKRVTTINNLDMIQCGDYMWRILLEHDGSEVYQLVIANKTNTDIILFYGEGIFSVRNFSASSDGSHDFFCFKVNFNETSYLVKALIEGEGGYLRPINHKDTIKIKENGE